MVSVLFVCTGNICRSPTAEGVFRHKIEELGLSDRVTIDSAGMIAYHQGEPPDTRSAGIAASRGVDLSAQRARQVVPADYHQFDYLLAMDHGHLEQMRSAAPGQSSARLELFLSFAADADRDEVPDPYYGGINGFEDVFDLVDAGCDALIEHLRQEGEI